MESGAIAMDSQRDDARHQASALRIRQAQQQGDFPRSNELASSFQLLCGVTACYFLTAGLARQFHQFTTSAWSVRSIAISPNTETAFPVESLCRLLAALAPLLLIVLLLAVVSHLAQNQTLTMFNKSIFKPSNVSPHHFFGRVFSLHNGMRAVVSLPKVLLLFTVISLTFWNLCTKIGGLSYLPPQELLKQLLDCVFLVLIATTATMFVLSIFDYVMEHVQFLNRQRMTDEQLREENRMQNINPQFDTQRKSFYNNLS